MLAELVPREGAVICRTKKGRTKMRTLLALVTAAGLGGGMTKPPRETLRATPARRREKVARGPLTPTELAALVWAQCMRDYHAGETSATPDLEKLLADALAAGGRR